MGLDSASTIIQHFKTKGDHEPQPMQKIKKIENDRDKVGKPISPLPPAGVQLWGFITLFKKNINTSN